MEDFMGCNLVPVCSTPKLGKRQSPGNKLPLHDSFLRGFYLSKSYCFCFFYLKPAVPAGSLYTAIINDSNYWMNKAE